MEQEQGFKEGFKGFLINWKGLPPSTVTQVTVSSADAALQARLEAFVSATGVHEITGGTLDDAIANAKSLIIKVLR